MPLSARHIEHAMNSPHTQISRNTLPDAAAANAPSAAVRAIRTRLREALRTGNAFAVREEVIHILADIGSGTIFEAAIDQAADTMRCPAGPDFEPDSAPPVPLTRPSGGP